MAPLPIISNTFQVSIGYSYLNTYPAANVLHVQSTVATAQEIADGVAATWWDTTTWPSIQSNSCSAGQVRVTPLDGSSTTAIASSASFGTTVGGRNEPASGLVDSLVMTQYTDLRGRSGRGRLYIPFLGEHYLQSDLASWQDANGDISGAYNAFKTLWNTNLTGINRGVVSRLHSSFHETVQEVLQYGYVGCQRGRLPRP
jgi:hypothetical protein